MVILRFFRPSRQGNTARAYAPGEKADIDKARQAEWDAPLVPLLSHRSGYVREAAVIRAGELCLPTLLPQLMPRVNDWVPQVRHAARMAVEAYLQADRFDAILRALPY